MLILLISYLFASEAGLCRADSYDPRLKPLHYGICLPKDKRSPSSTRPLEIEKPKSNLDRTAKYNAQERRIYNYLTKEGFDGADLNADGTKDIKIEKNSKGYQKISYSFNKDGKFNQISLYNPQGKLVRETVDQNMDGQVDYHYECKDQVCETRRDFVAGQANSVIRRTASDGFYEYEFFERKNGQLVLVKKEKDKIKPIDFEGEGQVVFDSEGGYCFECYDEYSHRFTQLLDHLKSVQAGYKRIDRPSERLERYDDFRISSTGMLIHEECFAPGRVNFDVEQAVVDGLVKTFTRFIELEKTIMEKTDRGPSAIIRSHVPDFVNLYDPNNWERSDVLSYYGTDSNGNTVEVNTEDPCSDLSAWAQHNNIDLKQGNNCRFASHIEKGRPKLFCEAEEMGRNSEEFAERGNAYASIKRRKAFAIKNKDGKSSIYHEPFIVFNPEGSRNFTDTRFQSTFIHEHFHNFGWEDFSRSHNSYSYFCQTAVFYEDTHADVLDDEAHFWGVEGCINSDYEPRNISRANHISRRIALDKD